jgi:omega-hydroxy-beta-dihydromenaquinone-9 sulfotransferase
MTQSEASAMHYLQCGTPSTVFKLLWNNRKRLSLKEFPKIFHVIFMSLVLSPIAFLENLFHARKIANTVVEKPPIFIVGHWRSGTTYLTSIMTKDESKAYFKAEQTYSFPVFITIGNLLKAAYNKVLPNKRPMDNMDMGRNEPQEENFAMATMIEESIMHMMSFPSNARFFAKCAFYNELNDKTRKKVRDCYLNIIKKLTYHTGGKQLVLKSPDNTCRVDMLLELFPDAKFIHIYRNPYKVFPSTVGMFNKLFPIFSLEDIEKNSQEEVQEVIMDIYEKLYLQYLKDKELIPKENLIELKYEEFVKDPMGHVEAIYHDLKIDGFEKDKEKMQQYVDAKKSYKTNNYLIDNKHKRSLNRKLKFFFDKYGYEIEEEA